MAAPSLQVLSGEVAQSFELITAIAMLEMVQVSSSVQLHRFSEVVPTIGCHVP